MNDHKIALSDAVREISNTSWLIAGKLVLSLTAQRPATQPSWSDGHNAFYSISEPTGPLPDSRPIQNTDNLCKVYDAGGVSVVWRAGEAFIKLKKIDPCSTREHVTLRSLHDRGGFDFEIPQAYYHGELGDVYCIVLGRIPGPTLAEAWPTLDEEAKQRYARRIANICDKLMAWQGTSISGVDGGQLSDLFLTRRLDKDCDPQQLRQNCDELDMDCTSLGFYHCDLGPGNIIVNGSLIGILDWETAGFVPKEWVRTKFCLSSGMNLPAGDPPDWRRRVSRELQGMGFKEVADEWMAWRDLA